MFPAGADKASAQPERAGGSLRVTVRDNGVDCDTEQVKRNVRPEGGVGLFSIEERMAVLGGSMENLANQGKGCRVVLTAPGG